MPVQTQPKTLADLLLVEVAPGWSKDPVLYAAGAVYPLGTVLALVNDKVQALDPAGTGAAKKAWAVAADNVDAAAGDKKGPAIARGAAVDLAELIWPAAITDVQKATALAELEARGIVARAAL